MLSSERHCKSRIVTVLSRRNVGGTSVQAGGRAVPLRGVQQQPAPALRLPAGLGSKRQPRLACRGLQQHLNRLQNVLQHLGGSR